MSDAPDLAATSSRLRLVVGQLVRQLRQQARGEHELPLPQAAVLGYLDRSGPMTISELAAVQSVRHQSVARTVGQLVRAGLVEQRPHPADRRKIVNQASDAGRDALHRQRARRADWLAGAIAGRLTPAEQREFARGVELLAKLVDG
jgi:DNA-binding MarR family transcriptional regulator